MKHFPYTGAPTYYDQIWTSIKTVFFGFLIATAVAVPLGILAGLSPLANAALNPLVQVFRPVLPLAWLPIVTMVVSALYTTNDGTFSKSFLVSAITVTLCSLWSTLINTALGVAQNPGLGKFVWDEFQNGSSQSLARIIVALLTIGIIGIIGFVLDWVMFTIQQLFAFSDKR